MENDRSKKPTLDQRRRNLSDTKRKLLEQRLKNNAHEGISEQIGHEQSVAMTECEAALAAIWTEVIAKPIVDVHSHFFQELGGHSLNAAQMLALVKRKWSIAVSMPDIFEAPTINLFSRLIEQRMHQAMPDNLPLIPVPRSQGLPLSYAQQRLWVLEQFIPGNIAYLVPLTLRLKGILDIDRLELAWQQLIARHETLRTSIIGDDVPTQYIHQQVQFHISKKDLQLLTEAQQQVEIDQILLDAVSQPFDLAQDSLLRVTLLQLNPNEYIMCMVLHHIITDGWSIEVMLRELGVLYSSEESSGELEPLPVQYVDYTLWQQRYLSSAISQEQQAYWVERLNKCPSLLLPTDYVRPSKPFIAGSAYRFHIAESTVLKLKMISEQANATLFMCLMAAFQASLSHITNQTDLAVATPIANRPRTELANVLGFFVNTLMIRVNIDPGQSFEAFLKHVRSRILEAYTHQDLPFEQVVQAVHSDRDPQRPPLAQVMLAFEHSNYVPKTLGDLQIEVLPMPYISTQFDLSLILTLNQGVLEGVVNYATDLFTEPTIKAIVDVFMFALQAIIVDPQQTLEILFKEQPHFAYSEQPKLTDPSDLTPASIPASAQHTYFQKALTTIWSEVLGQTIDTIDANFFALGGHSLSAAQLVARIRQRFQIQVPLQALFEAPTIAQLSHMLVETQISQSNQEPFIPTAIKRTEPAILSSAQQRLWFFNQLDPSSTSYLVPLALRIQGELDLQAFKGAWNQLIDRHEILRTTFHVDGTTPIQIIHDQYTVPLEFINLSIVDQFEQSQEVQSLLAHLVTQPFDLQTGPLFRLCTIKVAESSYIFAFVMHHIISDGWSFNVLFRDLMAFYRGLHEGSSIDLPELPIQYADYATWQQRTELPTLQFQQAYWQQQLDNTPILKLPIDYDRPETQRFNGTTYRWTMQPLLIDRLQAMTQQSHSTLFVVLLAAYITLLHSYTAESKLAVGTAIMDRSYPEFDDLIGLFVNTVVLRTQIDQTTTFKDLIEDLQHVTLTALANRHIPFEQVVQHVQVERDSRYPLVFQTMFLLQLELIDQRIWTPLDVQVMPLATQTSKFDLTFQAIYVDQALEGVIEYNTDLFDASTIERLAIHYQQLLKMLLEVPEHPIKDVLSHNQWLRTSESCESIEQIERILQQYTEIDNYSVTESYLPNQQFLIATQLCEHSTLTTEILLKNLQSHGFDSQSLFCVLIEADQPMTVQQLKEKANTEAFQRIQTHHLIPAHKSTEIANEREEALNQRRTNLSEAKKALLEQRLKQLRSKS